MPLGSGSTSGFAAVRGRVDRRLLLLALPLASGAGLVVHILAGIALPLAIAVPAAMGAAIWLMLLPKLQPVLRAHVRRRVGVGVLCGLVATLAYDAARYGTVALFRFSFQPFHVFDVFGRLFLGAGAPADAAFVVGALYHLCNGCCFGIAYVLAVRRPRVITGMAWGVALELCMAMLYPSWLRVQQLGEFLQVSAIAHLVYGGVLGALAARFLTGTTSRTGVRP